MSGCFETGAGLIAARFCNGCSRFDWKARRGVGPWKLGQRGAPLGARADGAQSQRSVPRASAPALHHLETWTRSYWGEEETIEIASDDDTPRATAARASSPTTTADGGVDGRAERGAARTSRTSTTAAAAQREGPVLSPGGSEAAAQLGRASRRRRGFTSPNVCNVVCLSASSSKEFFQADLSRHPSRRGKNDCKGGTATVSVFSQSKPQGIWS